MRTAAPALGPAEPAGPALSGAVFADVSPRVTLKRAVEAPALTSFTEFTAEFTQPGTLKQRAVVEPPASTSFTVEFTQPGTLGLVFSPETPGRLFTVEEVRGGLVCANNASCSATQRVQTGCVLVAVQGKSLDGVAYQDGLAMIRTAGRPVQLTFKSPSASVSLMLGRDSHAAGGASTTEREHVTAAVNAALAHVVVGGADRALDPTE